jgi:pimeloyl-ACP methyl ester carboxylesterase
MTMPSTKESLLKATQDMRALKARIAELERLSQADPTNVVGMACRLPRANDVNAFGDLMASGRSGLSPIIVLGHSMGASFAYDFAARLPRGSIRHLLLVSGPPPDLLVPIAQGWSKEQVDYLYEGLRRVDDAKMIQANLAADMKNTLHFFVDMTSSNLRVPATTVWGDRDPILTQNEVSSWERFFGGAISHEIVACGHSPHVEVPDILAAIVRRLL